jgi:hypothetical protein
MKKKRYLLILSLLLLLFLVVIIYKFVQKPLTDRDRIERDAVTATVNMQWDSITVSDIRDFTWRSDEDYDIDYYDKTFDIKQVVTVEYFLSTFALGERLGHTFLSFGLDDGSQIAVSIEARKEVWETYHPVRWLLNQYELIYVIADEEDLISLRTQVREDPVYRYEIATTPAQAQNLLRSLLDTTDELSKTAKFYNTITDNCTSVLRKHVNSIAPWTFSFHYSLFLTWLNDFFLFGKWYINTSSTKEELRATHRINEIVDWIVGEEEFSRLLRG